MTAGIAMAVTAQPSLFVPQVVLAADGTPAARAAANIASALAARWHVRPHVVTVLADTAIRGHDLDEAKARDALAKAEEARRNAGSELEIAKVEAEMSALAAQLAAIRKLRGK